MSCVRAATILLLSATVAKTEILTPPYFNLALGKRIRATATCGDEGIELYCKLVGATLDHDEHVIQGQVCDICDATNEMKKHPPEYAVDGMETWWQSPPLSRGMKYNEVNLTIDLGQEFHVAYVFVRMGNSPRPGLWALEKSTDYGKTYKPWQYFSDSQQDCERYFGRDSLQPITRDDSVICSTEHSKIVPLEGGEIPISLLNSRPSANKYFNSSKLQEWTRATNVRLRLMRTKNLLGHLMSVARQDPTVTRRYFYSIKDISIGGRCMCNGHADTCDPDPDELSSILVCRCQHNTCGSQCAECCPGFEQKKWRISQNWDRFECEPCNCHNHTTECIYDPTIDEQHLSLDVHGRYEGGGICQNCQHNTEGINCNKCKPTFFRPYGKKWNEIDVCQPCNCDPHFSTGNCAEEIGQCECRPEFNPPNCDSCAYGYFDYPNCKPCTCNLNGTEGGFCTPIGGMCPCKYNYAGNSCEICQDGYYSLECKNCECNPVGSASSVCDKDSGNCTCKSKFSGRTCNQCEAGFFNYPSCSQCNCDTSGTQPSICDDVTGQCICKTGFGGIRCDQCIPGYYMEVRGRERVCVPCNCFPTGSTSTTSCLADGKCNCLANFGGKQCDRCSPGYFKFPECLPCNCDVSGAIGSTCDDNGQCLCRPNFDGPLCDRCKEQFYNYPACEECNCDPRGVAASFAGCASVPAGELCECKDRVQGRICNDCQPLFWNLQEYNPLGCEDCNCHLPGTIGGLGTCNTRSGQCQCKLHVTKKQCNECQDGFYKLEKDNLFGCTACDCDIGGSVDNICNKTNGQCNCHSRVEGRRCDRPIRTRYFPTLYQFQYEVEEGFTQSGPVRYRSSEDVFPEYSWKGYVVFSLLQNEVINIVQISKSSFYRMVLKYINPLRDPVIASIIITPESVNDIQQKFSVLLKPTSYPQLVKVAGEKGNSPAPFVMNPGNWTVTIKTTKEVMIDNFVLIPEAYYEATVLTKQVDKPCLIGDEKLCRQFAYPKLDSFAIADVSNIRSSVRDYIDDPQQLRELNVEANVIPLLSDDQNLLQFNMQIEPNGPYVLVVEYVTPINRTALVTDMSNEVDEYDVYTAKGIVTVRFQSGDGPESYAFVNLNECPYTTPCRQVIIDDLPRIYIANVQDVNNLINLESEQDTLAGIKSIVAIPQSDWDLDYITPRSYCLAREGQCAPAVFSAGVDSKKVELESGVGGDQELRPPILDNSTSVIYLGPQSHPLEINSKVPSPGDYMFVVHYFQPEHPKTGNTVILTAGGQLYETVMTVEHCPSNSGCRTQLKQLDGNSQFPINDNFTLLFKGDTTRGVWLDYVLIIESSDFVDTALKEANMLDYTQEYIEKCAKNNYYISTNVTGFCREATFSITAEYNSGTFSCDCDLSGSTELDCEVFGGQCRCLPNVIGRTCNACKTGYYGFPECKPCNCPATAICDDRGECICPKNVEGENCDHCKPYTFNFDVQRGCDDCNCNALGVLDNQLQCEADNGNCLCKENVIGRVCDHCVPGHYAFPDCVQCSCDMAGTTDDVCDQNTAQCYCKRHVRGQACDTCKEEYFNLQPDNPDGCTKCYCFGKTTRCTSSYLLWAEISGMSDWFLVNIEADRTLNIEPRASYPNRLNYSVIGADLLVEPTEEHQIVYFGAPEYYLGKRLTSYGGYLTYSIFYTSRGNGHAVAAADVIIGGSNGYIVHNSVEQPPSLVNWMHSVRITEDEFTNLDGSIVTRDQFMNVLVNVTSLFIRATYWHEAVTSRLMDVTLDISVEDDIENSTRASSVEECLCPKAYRGLSCEQCAEGYYRLSSGPHAGFCVPCQCNGHAGQCDVNTGICLNCGDNTMGDHCEQCVPGYHGDATVGTQIDCLICACPMPYPSNNFAIGCELSENGSLISCDCKPGYGGPRCEFCTTGYYGVPDNIGDYCKPCNCSGNINVRDPGSCDSITGNCLKCVNNTAGAACNLCAPGFFGDAIFSKNCTACVCDEFGMERCDPSTGNCVCRPGVLGDMCNMCAPNHWGLSSGQGCTPCDCAAASLFAQCDENTGQCSCASGVTGKRCEQCAAGYWNYTKDGCDHCNCNRDISVGFTCNANGQCECLPGAIGEKCDRCPDRWVLIPHERCMECDSCTDALIFSIEDMSNLLSNETQEFKDKADSFFTTQRLNYISNQTEMLKPRVAELRNVELAEVTSSVKALETNAKNLLRSAEFAATDSEKQIANGAELAAKAFKTLESAMESSQKAKNVVTQVAEFVTGLELSQQPKVDSALAEAQQIKNDIAAKNLKPKHQQASLAFTNATAQLERMNIFVEPVKEQAKNFENLQKSTHELKNKRNEMLEYIDVALHKADAAERLNANNKLSKIGTKVLSVTQLNSAAMQDLIDAAVAISDAASFKTLTATVVFNSSTVLENMLNENSQIKDRLDSLSTDIPNLNNLANDAEQHTNNLRNTADNLRALADRENNNSRTQHAYHAASAYSSIVNEIKEAKLAADKATVYVTNATIINDILEERVSPGRDRSEALLQQAIDSFNTVEDQLRPNLTKAERAVKNALTTLGAASEENEAIKLAIPASSQLSVDSENEKTERVQTLTQATEEIMSKLGKDLGSSKEWAQTLPKLADEAQKRAASAQNQINNISTVDYITTMHNRVKINQQDLEHRRKAADEKLQKLRELIEQARTVANRIQVGVTFDSLSTLQPRLPDTIDEMSTSTYVSAYFRTKEKDGFLIYLGNPLNTKLRRTKSDDFMVLGIQNGYPYLVIDLGDSAESGRDPARITGDKFVSDNKWYQVIVDRVGRNIKLSIRESLANGTEATYAKDATLPGQHTIFNLDKEKSKLYIGGVPSDANLQPIQFPAFDGQIEELKIGDTPVGLWNFVSANQLKGARPREKLISSQSGPQEYRFNGKSHVTVHGRGYLLPQKNNILLFFRTYAANGLLFLVGDSKSFFSVQMQDGRVFLQVQLGSRAELVINGTQKTYNDGKWHRLDAGRYSTSCSLKVDNEIVKMTSSSDETDITDLDTMNFGGNNKGIAEVKDEGFDGCIRQISIDGVSIDLSDNKESIGVAYGCQFSSLVSLSGNNSFLRYVDITAENPQFTLKFKTPEPDGLLFAYFSRTQTATMQTSISLSLIKGRLVLLSQREQLDTGLSTYNDSKWHVVTVIHSTTALKLIVDDFDYFSSDTPPAPLNILNGVLFVGGLQPGYVVGSKVGIKAPFKGCIADGSLNGRVLNFLDPKSNNEVTFGRCGTTTSSGGVPPDRVTEELPMPPDNDKVLPVPTLEPFTPDYHPEIVGENVDPNQNVPVVPGPEATSTIQPVVTSQPVSLATSPFTTAKTHYVSTTQRIPPIPEAGCSLAYDSSYENGDPEEGYRFGTRNDSRIEYAKLPGRQLNSSYDLTITFRTFDHHGGLIFYATAEKAPTQFLALYMKDAKLHFSFNCGSETKLVVSLKTYNDTEWHTATLVRSGGHGKLTVDSEHIGEASEFCDAPAVLTPPYYYGGLRNITEYINLNLMDFYQPFMGCLKGLLMNGQYVTNIRQTVNALRCTNNIESGVYFGPSQNAHSNYLKLLENFKVGFEISISMEIKPRNSTGLLMSVHGRKDYMVLELLDNEVVASVENGKGPFQASYKLADKFSLCDGNWHKIHAVKSRHVVSVGVDGHFSDAGIGSSPSTDTRSALYIGGHERKLGNVRGVKSKRGFTGCIKNIIIKNNPLPIPMTAAGRNVHIGVCPTD